MIMMHLSKKISKAVDVGHDHDVPEYNFSKAVDVGHDASTMSRIWAQCAHRSLPKWTTPPKNLENI